MNTIDDNATSSHDHIKDASRLIILCIKDKRGLKRDSEYRNLLKKFFEKADFEATTHIIADGMGLKVIADKAGESIMIVPNGDETFNHQASFSRSTGKDPHSAKTNFIIISIAIAASFFPNSDALNDPTILTPRRKIDQLIRDFREFCTRLNSERSDELKTLNLLIDDLLVLPDDIPPTADKKKAAISLKRLFTSVLNYYSEIGFIRKITDDGDEIFTAAPRFEFHLREFGLIRIHDLVDQIRHNKPINPPSEIITPDVAFIEGESELNSEETIDV